MQELPEVGKTRLAEYNAIKKKVARQMRAEAISGTW